MLRRSSEGSSQMSQRSAIKTTKGCTYAYSPLLVLELAEANAVFSRQRQFVVKSAQLRCIVQKSIGG